MVVLGIDAHKRSHTVVAVDAAGHKLGQHTTGTTTADHLALLSWVEQFGTDRLWAVEDCRPLSRRLERDLLGAGQHIVRVPPKLMAHVRDSARSYGKSDPIDALAIACAALREPDLPTARLDGPARVAQQLPIRQVRDVRRPIKSSSALAPASRPNRLLCEVVGRNPCLQAGRATAARSPQMS